MLRCHCSMSCLFYKISRIVTDTCVQSLSGSQSREGVFFAFLNALQATSAVQTLHTAAVIKNLLQRGIEPLAEACRGNITFHEGPRAFCRTSSSGSSSSAERMPRLGHDPNLHLASTSARPSRHHCASTVVADPPASGVDAVPPSGLSQFLDGLFNPNRTGAELAVLAKSATERFHASIMVATNGRMALSGVDVRKQPRERALIQDSEILTMFAELDVDQNGYIDKAEFLRAFDRMGLPANTEYLRCVISHQPAMFR